VKNLLAWLLGCAGTAVAVLALTELATSGFHLAVQGPMRAVLSGTDSIIGVALGWIEPELSRYLHLAGKNLGLDLRLYPHWRYAFLLLWLYFASLSTLWWKAGGRGVAIFSLVWGFFVALIAGLSFGLVRIEPGAHDLISNALLSAIPLAAYLVFAIGISAWAATFLDRDQSWVEAVLSWLRPDLRLVTVAAALLVPAALATEIPRVHDVPNSGLLFAGLLIVLLSLYLVEVGVRDASVLRTGDESWTRAFLKTGSPRVGLPMMIAVVGTALMLLLSLKSLRGF
jgi:hypothetical protein